MYWYPEFPDHVYVELTNICNARCTICATPAMLRTREIMGMPLFRKIVDECGQQRAKKILPFLHGESLLVPGVIDYFRYIRQAAPETHVNLTTNGSRLSAALSEDFLREDLLDSVIVSIDAADRQTFESIRPGLDYEEVRDNVLHFIRRRNELKKVKPKVSIAMVTITENMHARKNLREVWKEADDVRFSVFFNWGGELQGNQRTSNKLNSCERLYHYITILADGRVAMCCFDSEAAYCVGDVGRDSVRTVWHSREFNEKREMLYKRDFERLKICSDCDYVNHPAWMGPLARLRPQMTDRFPQLTAMAENLYKRWLIE